MQTVGGVRVYGRSIHGSEKHGAAAPSVDFGSVAQMLSTLPKGLGGRHPNTLNSACNLANVL